MKKDYPGAGWKKEMAKTAWDEPDWQEAAKDIVAESPAPKLLSTSFEEACAEVDERNRKARMKKRLQGARHARRLA